MKIREMKKYEMQWMERSERSLTVRMKHEDVFGMNEDSNLSQSARASVQEDSQRTTTTNWKQKRETTKNKGSSMHEDSCIGINYAHMFPKCFRSLHTLLDFALSSCRQFNCCSCYHLLIFSCTRILCGDSHCANWSFQMSLQLPSVAANERQLQTIQLQQNREQ